VDRQNDGNRAAYSSKRLSQMFGALAEDQFPDPEAPSSKEDTMTIHVTETQKFIARAALEVSGADERLHDPQLIDDMIRAMLVIEGSGMQAYMLRGSEWSHRSRFWQDRETAIQQRKELGMCVESFLQYIDQARGEPARRIRGNRARRRREADQMLAERLREKEERREQRRLSRAQKLAEQPIEQLIA
jgi:hypothetical protein